MKPPFNALIVADGIEFYQFAVALQFVYGSDFTICFLSEPSTKLDLSKLDPESRVVLLGVTKAIISENDDNDWQTSLKDFVGNIQNAGHQVTGIFENWGADRWREVLPEPSFTALAYKPQDCERDPHLNVGDYFMTATGTADDDAIREIFLSVSEDGSSVGEMLSDALQSCPDDARSSRAKYLIEYFGSREGVNVPDLQIKQWLKDASQQRDEYEVILGMRVKLGNDFWSISKDTKWTSRILRNFAGALHQMDRAVVVHFNEALATGRQVSFSMLDERAEELISLLKKEGLTITQEPPYRAGTQGYVRILVQPEDENRAIEIIKDALTPLSSGSQI
jgi:hypothetical protein